MDTVASLGGAKFDADALEIDCVYSATQKVFWFHLSLHFTDLKLEESNLSQVLNAPPGLAPISFSDRAMKKIRERKTPVPSFYFDAIELGNYWGCDGEARRYHHTAPISTVYALREALAIVSRQVSMVSERSLCESLQGIDNLIAQHEKNAQQVYAQLEGAGLEMFVREKVREEEKREWKRDHSSPIVFPVSTLSKFHLE